MAFKVPVAPAVKMGEDLRTAAIVVLRCSSALPTIMLPTADVDVVPIVVAIAGASGSIYAKLLLDSLSKKKEFTIGVLMSDNAKTIWESELGNKDYKNYPFTFYSKNDFNAPFASGSAKYDTMIILPCSMGTLGRIANGISNDLLTRAADVILKERRRLVIF